MSKSSRTDGWFRLGMGLIIGGFSLYGLFALLGISFVLSEATREAGWPVLAILVVPGLILSGFVVLLAKVIVDRIGNTEDDHYSRTVDK